MITTREAKKKRKEEEIRAASKEVYETGSYKGKEYEGGWIQVSEELEAKYNAELAALEEKPYDPSKRRRGANGPSEYRMVGVSDNDRMTNAELEAFKAWRDKYVPGIPFEELDNIIQVNDTEQAWGVFENGVAKFVRGGLKGTEYHEVFEGIWASFLSESEK